MNSMTIRIRPSSEGGYLYEVYSSDLVEVYEDAGFEPEEEDGGWCTTTMLNALGMAMNQAEEIIRRNKFPECAGCNEAITGTVFKSTFDQDTDLCADCKGREKREGDFIAER